MTGLSDSFQRPINYLRVSVTDRCNLRCLYCQPPEGVSLLPRESILSYEEIISVVKAAAELGITRVRLSGGEPLLRAALTKLIEALAQIENVNDLSLTTNGTLLDQYAAELKQAGLKRVNISLDTLRRDRYELITRHDELGQVLRGIERAKSVGLSPVKLNVVVMRGINDDELSDFVNMTFREGWHVRFIELMPLAHTPSLPSFVGVDEMKQRLEELGELEPCSPGDGGGPARYFRFSGSSGTIGFISPVTQHFCFHCNRLRLTAEGKLRPCLLDEQEFDLRLPLRSGASAVELKRLIEEAVSAKPRQHHLSGGSIINRRSMSQIGG